MWLCSGEPRSPPHSPTPSSPSTRQPPPPPSPNQHGGISAAAAVGMHTNSGKKGKNKKDRQFSEGEGETFNMPGCQHISLFGRPLFSERAVKVTARRARQIHKFALLRRTAGHLITQRRAPDNKFAIKTEVNVGGGAAVPTSLPPLPPPAAAVAHPRPVELQVPARPRASLFLLPLFHAGGK